jgi:glycosyltransferase involved in cell wall biosynthesis
MRRLASVWEGRWLRYVDILITVGPSLVREFERRYQLKRPPLFLPNYPSLALLDRPKQVSIRTACGLGDDAFVTLYMGGVNPLRNIEGVVRAHRHLPENHVFVVMGPGVDYYEDEYRALAAAEGVADRVFFLPSVPMDEVVTTATEADCGIVMLRNICRNFYWFYPNKLFEYALAGIPIAASGFPDVKQFVEGQGCGVTFDPDSPRSIAQALQSLADDPVEARAMGERGRASIVGGLNWESAVEDLAVAYRSLIA